MDVPRQLERGRAAFAQNAWNDAFDALSAVEPASALAGEDLERLATAAYLLGREEDSLAALDRAHRAYVESGDDVGAARCAFRSGLHRLFRGEMGPATGWLSRASRLLAGRDCVEQGYLMLPAAEQHLRAHEGEAAYDAASQAAAIGERFEDADLVAAARHLQGKALLQQGRVRDGLALLDEAMLTVTTGELSPIMRGLVYCSVIEACQQVYAVRRAREWTSALARWCQRQPEMVAFTTTCLIRRAEILHMQGDWTGAIEEARRACAREGAASGTKPPGSALYQEGEVHRLRGDFEAAETAYRHASEVGRDPQPGLALLRLAQGRTAAARSAVRRALSTTMDPLQRSRLLPAALEIALASGDLDEARGAVEEMAGIALRFPCDVLDARTAQGRGAIALAEGDAQGSLTALRQAWETWDRVAAPYLAARVRVLRGLACRALGDEDGCELELEAARAVFESLGAAPDLARVELLAEDNRSRPAGLTAREMQVLRLVATGKTNKVIAGELSVSERTIDRHLSNIFHKLDITSRAAATAYAYQHDLL